MTLLSHSKWENAAKIVDGLDDAALVKTWVALLHNIDDDGWDYNGINFGSWCELVYSELDRRGLGAEVDNR
jgi:hypothetical protein